MAKKQVFSIRKLKNGTASVAIATVLFGVNTNQVSASETASTDVTLAITSETTQKIAASISEELIEESVLVKASATVSLTEDSLVSSDATFNEPVKEPNAEKSLTVDTEVKRVDQVPVENQKFEAKVAINELKLGAEPTVTIAVDAAVAPVADAITEEMVTPNIVRYEGKNREAVAVNVAKAHFSDSSKVIIVNRDKFADAISATNISQGQYPVLYTKAGSIDQGTIDLLKTMPLNEIYILGGTASVNEAVVSQLKQATGVHVTRVGGKDRYDMNVSAIELQYTNNEHVVIASGEIYTDALYGVSYANTIDSPVLLSKKSQLTMSTIDLIKELGVKQATLIGGTKTLTQSIETQLKNLGIITNRVAGDNRYSGSAEVANVSYQNPNNVVVASGEGFADALVSAPLAQKLNAPILLVRKDKLDFEVNQYLSDKKNAIKNIYIQGGTVTITASNEQAITAAVIENELEMKLGNTNGNILNGGHIAESENWIFYSNKGDNGSLWRMNKDGSGKIKLVDGNTKAISEIGDGWIYFINDSYGDGRRFNLKKTRYDGQNTTIVDRMGLSPTNAVIAEDGLIYYTEEGNIGTRSIQSIGKNGNNYSMIAASTLGNFLQMYNGSVYFAYDHSSKIPTFYRLKIGEHLSESKSLFMNMTAYIQIVNDWIYFIDYDDNKMYRIDLEGNNKQQVLNDYIDSGTDEKPTFHVTEEGWIYYVNDVDRGMYRVRVDGLKKTKLNDNPVHSINVASGWVYYYDTVQNNWYKMTIEGNNKSLWND